MDLSKWSTLQRIVGLNLITIPIIFIIMAAVPIIGNHGFKHRRCHSKRKLTGKTALITGASAGIGKETARDFAARGARVIMACRNVKKAQLVADDIILTTGNKDVVVYELDTSSLASVRKCALKVLKRESRLDILVNNAGIGHQTKKQMTEDGLELIMATNHYGHFLLTNLLLGLIKTSSPARIVTVASDTHFHCRNLDVQNLNFEGVTGYQLLPTAYAQSKLCNVLFAFELARKLEGTGVTSNCLHPGWVATDIFGTDNIFYKIFKYVVHLVAKNVESGAQTTIYTAVAEEVENLTGKFLDNCQVRKSSKLSTCANLAEKLWKASLKDVNMQPDELHY